MVRWIRVGLVLLAAGLAWFLFARAKPAPKAPVPKSVSALSSAGAKMHTGQLDRDSQDRGGSALPVPVRMSANSLESGGVQPKATSLSLRDRFIAASSPAGESRHVDVVRDVVNALLPNDSTTKVQGLECRSDLCLLKIGGDDKNAVMKLVDSLQDERGFYGKAESIMLSRDAESILIYLQFAQDEDPSETASDDEEG